jgi:CoA:oxalate CoA-transferase
VTSAPTIPAVRTSASLPLAQLSVVECGQGVAAALAAKLFALWGARVIKVEPPEGDLTRRRRGPFPNDIPDPDQSGLFLYLNADKLGITLDL